MLTAEPLTTVVAEHGEGPVYSPRWSGPRWVDMLAGDICELTQDGQVRRRHIDEVAALIRPRRRPGFVVVGKHRLWLSAEDDLESAVVPGPRLLDDPAIRMNEGGCDPAGNLYAGSMAHDKTPGAAALFRIDKNLKVHRELSDLTISNGIGWSPDHKHAYFVDTPLARIDIFDWSTEAGLHHRRPFAPMPHPDGLTVDADGGIWVASIGGSIVQRFDTEGQPTHTVKLPVSRITAVTFTGSDLRTLLITTSRKGLCPSEESLSGALFACEPGFTGLPLLEFDA